MSALMICFRVQFNLFYRDTFEYALFFLPPMLLWLTLATFRSELLLWSTVLLWLLCACFLPDAFTLQTITDASENWAREWHRLERAADALQVLSTLLSGLGLGLIIQARRRHKPVRPRSSGEASRLVGAVGLPKRVSAFHPLRTNLIGSRQRFGGARRLSVARSTFFARCGDQ